jgi:hypothetical protein
MFGVLLNLVVFVKMIGQIIRKYKIIDMSLIISVVMRLFIKYMYIKAHTITNTQMNAGTRSGEGERLMLFIVSQVISGKHPSHKLATIKVSCAY